MQHNTDNQKATVRQKAPEYPTAMLESIGYHKGYRAARAHADKLAEELRKLIEITPYSGTISARETLDAYDNER